MLQFCDEVVVADGGSDDGTWEQLTTWANKEEKLKVFQHIKDYSDKRFAVFDGELKADARSHCTMNWCWQQDSDEIVHEDDAAKIKVLAKKLPKPVHLLALPVIEYWGGEEKVRCDINPWKWRLSRNHSYITHGIPGQLRKIDKDGKLYALQGTDGCDYIDRTNFNPVPCTNFYTPDVHQVRTQMLQEDRQDLLKSYQTWFNKAIKELPSVHHYSWFNLERKIKTYRDYWTKHWLSLYDIKQEDTAENNMFFNKPWSKVSEQEIKNMSIRLKNEMGGWIFHRKIDFSQPTPFLKISKKQPKIMIKED
jgi:glycosyltransferase involved in cell wall biosynthesis